MGCRRAPRVSIRVRVRVRVGARARARDRVRSLSASTVFMLSIQSVSTGPSMSSHFSSGFSSAHTSRITLESTPSVHSNVCRSYSPGWG